MTRETEHQYAQRITIQVLRQYLLLKNWSRRENIRQGIDLYRLNSEEYGTFEILLPQLENRSDTERRKADALRILSQLENRNIADLFTDISSVGCDVWRSVIPNALVVHEAISLKVAEHFIKTAKALLTASATTETAPKPFFERSAKAAVEFANECRFAHTFRGSFGFAIESPLTANTNPIMPEIEENPPFERRVLQRLARGIKNVLEAGERLEPLIIAENYQTGLSANMCEGLVDLMDSVGGQTVRFDFAFSPDWRPAADLFATFRADISPAHADLVKAAAKKLRLQEFERNRTVVGRVVRLESETDPSNMIDDIADKEIAIQWNSQDFGNIKVRVTLPATQYLAALEAHGKGQFVSVAGLIDRVGKRWILLYAREFQILPQAS